MAEDPVPTSAPSHTASAPTYAVDPPCKLVLVVNSSLNMSPGKIASQCSHATLGAVFRLGYESLQVRTWLGQGEPIIVVQAAKEALGGLESKSMGLGLPTFRVHDAGRTEVVSGSFTVLAVGPAPSADIDVVTRSLSLL
ncbi:peptidyl-tRNA hydrolase [Chytriomyces sp. MP71]|nr:peptidyl-tRNA hydrolase [Chytriomyces sp. MP71]